MSIEQAKEFLVDLAENEDATAKADDAYLGVLVAVAAELGYVLSKDEVKAAMQDLAGLDLLTDDDLSEVSGFMMGRGLALDSLSGLGFASFSPVGFLRVRGPGLG